MVSEKLLYVVFLGDIPIAVHKWPWAALQEAKERCVSGKSTSVIAYKHAYPVGVWGTIGEENPTGAIPLSDAEFSVEGPTDPDCVPCSHGASCDDEWRKTNPKPSGNTSSKGATE